MAQIVLLTLRKKYGFSEERVSQMGFQHEAILAALKARDAKALEEIIRTHAEGGKNDLLERMKKTATG